VAVNRHLRRKGKHCTQHRTSVRFREVDSDWNFEYNPNGVNVSERDITLPGRSEVSLAATTSCRLQLCAVLASNVVTAVLLTPPATPS
jgi:hypothetical protein